MVPERKTCSKIFVATGASKGIMIIVEHKEQYVHDSCDHQKKEKDKESNKRKEKKTEIEGEKEAHFSPL